MTTQIKGASQYIRLKDGSRALYCAGDYSLYHPSTDQLSQGVFSYELGKWFSSVFNYQMYLYDNMLSPYDNPQMRNQHFDTFEKMRQKHQSREMIQARKDKYRFDMIEENIIIQTNDDNDYLED